MGIIIDTLSIFTGGIIGGIFGKKIRFQNTQLFSIAIMLISLVGLLENILKITGDKVIGEHTIVVTLALVVGGTLGGLLKMEDRLSALSQTKNMALNGFIDAVLFFGIGGLQISGPILYAMTGDSFQLILKGIIDFPFAIGLGLFIGLLNLVPYLQLIAFLPTILLALLKAAETGGNFWLILLSAGVVFAVVQLIQDMYLTPKIMGKAMGLNPAIILLSLSVWGSLLGIIGLIIALPLTTLLLSYYRRFVLNETSLGPAASLENKAK